MRLERLIEIGGQWMGNVVEGSNNAVSPVQNLAPTLLLLFISIKNKKNDCKIK